MGQVLHGCARTTAAVRLAIQGSQESVRALATRHGVSPTTIQTWRKRSHVHDAAMGPKQVRSSTLTLEQEAAVRTGEGKLYLFVAIDRTSKFAVARLADTADRQSAVAFLDAVIEAVPYHIHTVLTDNGIQFCHPPRYRSGPTAQFSMHLFDRLCRQHGIEHRLTKPNHPWTNGQVERMNRTIKDATVKRYHYADHQQLTDHLDLFVAAYNHARRLKTLKGLTPHDYVCRIWTQEPKRFRLNPYYHTSGLNS